jgi:hypothetical protein
MVFGAYTGRRRYLKRGKQATKASAAAAAAAADASGAV